MRAFFSSDVWEIMERKEHPSIINSLRGDNGETFLMEAVYEKHFNIFVHLLKQSDISQVNDNGWNVFHLLWFVWKCWTFENVWWKGYRWIAHINQETNKYKRTTIHYTTDYINQWRHQMVVDQMCKHRSERWIWSTSCWTILL